MATEALNRRGGWRDAALPVAVVLGTAGLAVVLAQAGLRALLVVVAAIGLGAALMFVRDRALLVLVLLVFGIQFTLHKSATAIDTTISSGAPSVYITSVDVLVVLLYGLWYLEGTLASDLGRAVREQQSLLLLPLAAVLVTLLSFPAANNVMDALSEFVRELWTYPLFLYFAVRLRDRARLPWVLGSLLALAAVQAAIVAAQWRLGHHLGLGFLGEDSGTYLRTLDGSAVVRPAGTSLHPDILAAFLGPIGLLGLAAAIIFDRLAYRLACLAGAAAAFAGVAITETRASIVAAVVVGVLMVGWYAVRRRIPWGLIGGAVVVLAIVTWRFWSKIKSSLIDNLGTSHFHLEVQARLQLNDIAFAMMRDHPLVGVGLNNFMATFDAYNPYGVIYRGYPAHNFYLVVFAETGFIGFVALAAAVVALVAVAVRLARVEDPLLRVFGVGALAMYGFFALEELLSFSLREDQPSAVFWLLAGLTVSALALAPVRTARPEAGDAA